MTDARTWIAGLATLAWGLLCACESDEAGYELPPSAIQPAAGAGAQGTGSAPLSGNPPATTPPASTGAASPGPMQAAPPAGPTPVSPEPMADPPAGTTPMPTPMGDPPASTPSMFPGTMPTPPAEPMPPAGEPMSPPTEGTESSPPPGGVVDLSSCAPPADGSTAQGTEAWTIVNELRLAAGAGCMNMVPELNTSAQTHCDYRAMNAGTSCDAGSHGERAGCPGFTGADVQSREVAAGYPRQLAYTEVAYAGSGGGTPEVAIAGWLATPFHRIPIVDPFTTDMGWGSCATINFGRGTEQPPDDTIVVFPHDGQSDVPVSFNGLEAPMPPPPPGGFPSSYPVSIYAKALSVTEHVLMKDGDDTPLEHMWLDRDAPETPGQVRPYFGTTAMLYGAPFEPNTTYRVRMAGTHTGGSFDLEWTFTTGEAPRWGGFGGF